MSDASQRAWRFYLDDRIDFTGKMVACTDHLDLAGFVASGRQHRSANGIGSTPCSVGLPASAQLGALPAFRAQLPHEDLGDHGDLPPAPFEQCQVGPAGCGQTDMRS